jgi:hypothetical protein
VCFVSLCCFCSIYRTGKLILGKERQLRNNERNVLKIIRVGSYLQLGRFRNYGATTFIITTISRMTSSITTLTSVLSITTFRTTVSSITIDTQHYYTQHYYTQNNVIQYNDTQNNDTQHNDTQNNYSQNNNTKLNDTQYEKLSMSALRITKPA